MLNNFEIKLLKELSINIGADELENARKFLDFLLDKMSKKKLVIKDTNILVGYGGGKDSTWVIAFIRLVQLLCKEEYSQTFKIRVISMNHMGMPKQVLLNMDSVYRILGFYNNEEISMDIFSYRYREKFSTDYEIPASIKMMLRTDILMSGHRSHGNPRATFCSTCNLHMIGSVLSSIDNDTDFILTGDSLDELKVYAQWLNNVFQKFDLKGNSKKNRNSKFVKKIYKLSYQFFANLLPENDKSLKERLPITHSMQHSVPLIISIFGFTKYDCEKHWNFLTKFLGFKFFSETLNFTESDCQHPLLMAHLRGLTAEIDGRGYEQGIREYLQLANKLMKEKRFPKKLILIINKRYSGKKGIDKMKTMAIDYSEDTLEISEKQLRCMIYSPFANHAENLFKYINDTAPELIKKFGIRKEKIELDKIMNNTELMQFLEICSGLKEEQIMKLYNSDLLGRNIKPSKNRRCKDCFFNILLEKDPHKREISYMSMMGIKVTEMIYGR